MDTTFVTGLYYNLNDTEFNGRISRDLHYPYSTRNILNTGVNLCLFTGQEYSSRISQFLGASDNKNWQLIIQELKDSKYYNYLKSVKSNFHLVSSRCYEIMYSKTDWLRTIIKTNPYNSKYFYWIDAGLSHHGLFPQRFRRNNTGDPQYDQWYNYNLFDETLVDRLLQPTIDSDKIFCIGFEQSNSLVHYPWLNEVYDKPRSYPYHFIGGLFGGLSEQLLWFCDLFDERLDKAFKLGLLPMEEQIYTSIFQDYYDRFKHKQFNFWYYPDPSNPIYENSLCHLEGREPKCFYEMFL
jgi:hypothetical protein